jgi:hypothetical protein
MSRLLVPRETRRHTLCVRSLPNAFWCLTTAEGIHYASTLSCMPSTKGIPLRLLSIHRSFSLAVVWSLTTLQDKPHVSAISRMPSVIPYMTFLHLTHKGIPYASALSRMPSGVSRQLKAYPMRPFCIRSLSHAVRCLATPEGLPYVSALSRMPSGVLATDKGIPYEPIRPPLAPLIEVY